MTLLKITFSVNENEVINGTKFPFDTNTYFIATLDNSEEKYVSSLGYFNNGKFTFNEGGALFADQLNPNSKKMKIEFIDNNKKCLIGQIIIDINKIKWVSTENILAMVYSANSIITLFNITIRVDPERLLLVKGFDEILNKQIDSLNFQQNKGFTINMLPYGIKTSQQVNSGIIN